MADLTLEIIEGAGAGRQMPLTGPVTIGRGADADVVLEDGEVSRAHARVTPNLDGSATVEDLNSTNGTFVNHNELWGPARLDPGDNLQIGVTVMELRSSEQIAARPSAVITVPPGLRTAERPPTYVNPEVVREEAPAIPEQTSFPTLDKYLDVRVRRRAALAPLALFVLVCIALVIYFSAH